VAAGAHLVLLDCDGQWLAAATAALGAATAVHGDVSRWEDCQAATRAAASNGPPCPGAGELRRHVPGQSLKRYSRRLDASLGVNVKGTALMAGSIVPLLRTAGRRRDRQCRPSTARRPRDSAAQNHYVASS
jgi:NAD(P)-dependent dehydrogenase (short-subunit alcohol dehydrogenase family)